MTGELNIENDFWKVRSPKRVCQREAMVARGHDLSITRQAKVFNLSRGAVCYKPRQVSNEI
jgi:hypothetical protein